MTGEQFSGGFKEWVTIVVQGKTSIEKVAKQAEAERSRVKETLGSKSDIARKEGLRNFCFMVQALEGGSNR